MVKLSPFNRQTQSWVREACPRVGSSTVCAGRRSGAQLCSLMNAGGDWFLTQNWHVSRVAQHIVEGKCFSAHRDHQLQSSGELLAVCTWWRCEQNRVERISNFDINIVWTGGAILPGGRASFGRALLVWPYRHDRSCLKFGLLLARTRGRQLRDGSNQNQAQERRNAKLSDVHFVDFFSGELSCRIKLWTPARSHYC